MTSQGRARGKAEAKGKAEPTTIKMARNGRTGRGAEAMTTVQETGMEGGGGYDPNLLPSQREFSLVHKITFDDNLDERFPLAARLIGKGGRNVKHICQETGAWEVAYGGTGAQWITERCARRREDWERLNEPLASKEELPLSSYFVTADFNGWGLEQMQLQEDGSWRLEVHLIRPGGSFQILRNRDPDQTMYPVEGEPRGPDDLSEGRCWTMKGSPKELFSITLRRQVSDGLETRKEVHIERLGEKELDEEQICSLRRLRLSAFGTWEPGESRQPSVASAQTDGP
eukprot:g22362.t1